MDPGTRLFRTVAAARPVREPLLLPHPLFLFLSISSLFFFSLQMPPQPKGKQPQKLTKTPTTIAATATTATLSLMELAAGKAALTKKFGRAAATTDKYEQWLKQGQVWHSKLMDSKGCSEHPLGCPNLEEFCQGSSLALPYQTQVGVSLCH